MKPIVHIACLLVALPVGICVADQSSKSDKCEKNWSQIFRDKKGHVDETLLSEWKSHEQECKGSGVYEIQLASIYLQLGKLDLARKALESTSFPPKFKTRAEIVGINVEYLEALSDKLIDTGALKRLEKRIVSFNGVQPNVNIVLGILGHVRVMLGMYSEAIEPLEKVIQDGKAGDVGDYRNLTIAFANTGRYEEALHLLDKTYSLSKEVTSDEEFMYAAALSYSAVGKVDSAKNMLTLILNKKPNLQNDPRYREVVLKAKELSNGKLK